MGKCLFSRNEELVSNLQTLCSFSFDPLLHSLNQDRLRAAIRNIKQIKQMSSNSNTVSMTHLTFLRDQYSPHSSYSLMDTRTNVLGRVKRGRTSSLTFLCCFVSSLNPVTHCLKTTFIIHIYYIHILIFHVWGSFSHLLKKSFLVRSVDIKLLLQEKVMPGKDFTRKSHFSRINVYVTLIYIHIILSNWAVDWK